MLIHIKGFPASGNDILSCHFGVSEILLTIKFRRKKMKILVAYDGTLQAKEVLKYGIEKAKENGGEVTALYVFNSGMFIDYEASPGAEGAARRESFRFVQEARALMNAAGSDIKTSVVVEEGNPEEEIGKYAADKGFDIVFTPPRYKSIIKNAPCPVSVIPGHIIVPVDNNDSVITILGKIIKEAKATGSTVDLLGIIPVHIYGKGEESELERIEKETSQVIDRVKKLLQEEGVEAKGIIARGYPDEEILKAAENLTVSMVIIPDDSGIPSELSKAADIILDEPDKTRVPVLTVSNA